MPVLDGEFEAFVTNLGKYNEGMLVGEWVKFPTTEEEMQKVFERIGIGKQDAFGQPYEEWFITDYECPIYGVQKMLGEYESLDKLNYLAALIDELSLSDQEKLVAIMESGCDEVSDIDDLINLTFNLDCYDIMPGINNEYDLGYYYAHEAGIYSEKDLGPLANYMPTAILLFPGIAPSACKSSAAPRIAMFLPASFGIVIGSTSLSKESLIPHGKRTALPSATALRHFFMFGISSVHTEGIMNFLLNEAKRQGIRTILTRDTSRISRDVSSFMRFERRFKENGIRFEYLSKPDNELPVTPMMEAFEAAYKKRRAKNGTRA